MMGCVLAIQLGYALMHWYGLHHFLKFDVFRATNAVQSRLLTQHIVFGARQIEVQCTFNNSAYTVPSDMLESIATSADHFGSIISKAKQDTTLFNPKTYAAWRESEYTIKQRKNYSNAVLEQTNAIVLFNLFQSLARSTSATMKMARCAREKRDMSDPTILATNSMKNDNSWLFVLDNGIKQVESALSDVLLVALKSVYESMQEEQNLFTAISLTAVLIPLCFIIAVSLDYAPLSVERANILSLFLNLPKDTIVEMSSSVKSSLHQLTSTISSHESSSLSAVATSKASCDASRASSMGSSYLGSSSNSSLDSTEGLINQKRGKKALPIWRKVFLVFLITTILELALLIASTTIMFEASKKVFDSSIEMYHAGSRQALAFRVLVLAQELIRRDVMIWPEWQDLRTEYELSI
jgi:hypothetical protein